MGFLSRAWAIARKDIVAELRTRETVFSMLLFGFLVILIFNFGIEPGLREENLVKPGVLWAAFTFAGILGLNRSFAAGEGERLPAGAPALPGGPGRSSTWASSWATSCSC